MLYLKKIVFKFLNFPYHYGDQLPTSAVVQSYYYLVLNYLIIQLCMVKIMMHCF